MLESLPAGTLMDGPDLTPAELQLAVRNHSMPLEALRYPITPLGLHYLLTHFDIPQVDPSGWALSIGGHVKNPLRLNLEELRARPASTLAVTLECAGNGRSKLSPRPLSQPWLFEAVGTAEWTGTALAPLLREAGLGEGATEVVFTGLDQGLQGGIRQHYERALPLDVALAADVLLAHSVNGVPLPPQHGFPARVIVPGWYGMAQVKWLRAVTVTSAPFEGYQQVSAYHFRTPGTGTGTPVTRILPRALMVPPGVPDFMSRTRFLSPSRCELEGRAWSGWAPVTRVEVSVDGGRSWTDAALGESPSQFAWRPWTYTWDATRPGAYELCARATDGAGNSQPETQRWNLEGVQNNSVQRISVVVTESPGPVQRAADESAP
jgi:DMSO/TMAO reductase YedYZ molybdopterin-dependent catalytic subunit